MRFFRRGDPQAILDAYFDAWRFWHDGETVFGMTIRELELAEHQAARIAKREAEAWKK